MIELENMTRKSTPLSILAFYVYVSSILVSLSVADRDNSGFISIDCGASRDYVDVATGIWYQTDEAFIGSGTNHELPPSVNLDNFRPIGIGRQMKTLRSFPEGERNCYTLKPKRDQKKHKYLIRAVFVYGNYDNKYQGPVFDLYVGVNYWGTVRDTIICEIIIQEVTTGMVQVCLVNTGQGTPLINTLELRPLNDSIYSAPLPLSIVARYDIGLAWLPLNNLTRYKDDVYDRMWQSNDGNFWDVLKPSVEVVKLEDSAYKLPLEVLRTASQPLPNTSIIFPTRWNTFQECYLFLHFAEIEKLPFGHKRIINVTFHDQKSLSQKLTLEYLKPVTISSNIITGGGVSLSFTVTAAADSDAPPIINAYEIYTVVPQPKSPTAIQDVNAIIEIKRTYRISRISWQGDPCVPSNLTWDGLVCSFGNDIRIISLNLSSSMLTGQITVSFSELKKLESLDLSNNELIGQLPEFLATLPNLKFINVAGNNLTGSIPKVLKEKANLQLSVANNPGLCQTNSSKEPKIVPIIASVAALVIVVIIASLVAWRFRQKRAIPPESRKTKAMRQKNQSFSYSEVLCITNKFETAIGEGGFGKVYLGTLKDDTQVAVKLLSPSSMQGYKEFQSEAQLLTVIHHRNLVSLVGYCDENDVKALVYEYMDNGDLDQLLSEKNSAVLKWNERLQVAVDVAKGLDYLHNGCQTPIIHRDLKPSNILLNKFMVAKIADFGLSRTFANERDSHISTKPAGTPGYIDPEFQKFGKLNKKSDIYSFGMILLQLVTGHPPIRRELENICFILDWVRPKIDCGDIQGIIDARLNGEFHVTSAWKIVETALSCILPRLTERPDIGYILHELKECLAMESDHTKSNRSTQGYQLNYTGQIDSLTTLSAR